MRLLLPDLQAVKRVSNDHCTRNQTNPAEHLTINSASQPSTAPSTKRSILKSENYCDASGYCYMPDVNSNILRNALLQEELLL
jgi:hypothetical protein